MDVDSLIKANTEECMERNVSAFIPPGHVVMIANIIQSEIMELSQKIVHIQNDNANQIKLKQSAIEEKDRLCVELAAYHEQLEKLRVQISDMHGEKTKMYAKLSQVNIDWCPAHLDRTTHSTGEGGRDQFQAGNRRPQGQNCHLVQGEASAR